MSTNENKSGRPKKEDNPFNDIFRKLIGTATQQEVADKIGVSRQNVGRWLSGNTAPDINTLSKIADAYKVSTDYLLGRTPNKTTNPELQAVCKYTGLTQEAVYNISALNKLHQRTKYTTNPVTVSEDINLFIGSDNFEFTFFAIHSYLLTYFEKTKAIDLVIQKDKKYEEEYKKGQHRLYLSTKDDDIRKLQNEIDFTKWKLTQTFLDCIDDLTNIATEFVKGADENG